MIRAEHITKSFDGRVVLDDISIEFLTGKTNLIIGRSGSGKTVLLKTLVGLHEPDSGDVWYDDTNFTRLDFRERRAIRKDIGMIFQGGALLDSSTVEENVKLPLDLFTSQSEKEKMERVDFCLQRVRLEDANHLYPAELSGGMIKRVAIARAIVLNPRYLFCDEPNSGLDPQTSIVIDNLIHEGHAEAKQYRLCADYWRRAGQPVRPPVARLRCRYDRLLRRRLALRHLQPCRYCHLCRCGTDCAGRFFAF